MNYHVSDDVALPAVRSGKGYKDAALALRPGQSVLLPTTYASGRAIVASCYSTRQRRRGEFVVRPEGVGVRIWRKAE